MKKKIAVIFGTRPEIIKISPFIKGALRRNWNFFVIHTGQHYSEIMDKVFRENFSLPEPKYNLEVGSGTHAEQVGKMMIGIEKVLLEEKPDYVCVYADLNSSLAGALAAAKLNIPIIQLEGGLRSFDRTMPEEVNRVVTDRLASYLFAPTQLQKEHLEKEGITENIFVVGNLIADVVNEVLPKAIKENKIHERLGLENGKYFLATIHRPAAVDNPENFQKLLSGLALVAGHYQWPVIYPIHPRSKKNLDVFGLTMPAGIRPVEPLGYLDFMSLASRSKVIFSDSGSIQEEASIMQVPLVSLRENTERPESLEIGSNVLAGFEPETILEKAKIMAERRKDWRHPYGENVAEKMLDILEEKLEL